MNEMNKQAAGQRSARAKHLAYGNWPLILGACGLAESYFCRRHGPCPLCGGKDRYRWSDKHGGVWVCNNCTQNAGAAAWADGFALLMKYHSIGFPQAVDHVLAFFGQSVAPQRPQRPTHWPRAQERRPSENLLHAMQRMRAIWDAALPLSKGDPVDLYLGRRVPGLTVVPQHLRYHPCLDYWCSPDDATKKPVLLGRFPAMVAQAFDAQGNWIQLHKTYLTCEGAKADVPVVKKLMRGVGSNTFSVPLMQVQGDTIGFAEGIESALAAAMLCGLPVWSCLSGPSMARYRLPPGVLQQVQRVLIFADHDPKKPISAAGSPSAAGRYRSAGSHYAGQLAERIRAQGKRVLVVKASRVGNDMADHWSAVSAQSASVAA